MLFASAVGVVPVAASCGDSNDAVNRLPPMGDDDDDDRPSKDASTDRSKPSDGALPDSGPSEGRVYAHTTDTLYVFEPFSRTLKVVAKFDCLKAFEDVIDIAVDRAGAMYATTFRRFLTVDPITAHCSEVAVAGAIDYPNALSFVPAGTVDPGKEALVGYASTSTSNDAVIYVRIDTSTGAMTTIGNLNASDAGVQYRSSGDVISLIQDAKRSYVTVKAQSGTPATDLLAEIDPVKGSIKRIIGDTKETDLFGFGYWAGKGYGFSDTGRIVEIDMANGTSVLVKTLLADGGAPVPWYGAGVTTQAPVAP